VSEPCGVCDQKRIVDQESARRRFTETTAPRDFEIATFASLTSTRVVRRTLDVDALRQLLSQHVRLSRKEAAGGWSPTRYWAAATTRGNDGVAGVCALVYDLDHHEPPRERLAPWCWIGHTTYRHTPEDPRWRIVLPLAVEASASDFPKLWQRGQAALAPQADRQCKDVSRMYYLPSCPHNACPEVEWHGGRLLEVGMLPALPEPTRRGAVLSRRGPLESATLQDVHYAGVVLDGLASTAPGARNAALFRAAAALGRRVAAGQLPEPDVEQGLYAAAERCGLVADDGERAVQRTIRSGLDTGYRS